MVTKDDDIGGRTEIESRSNGSARTVVNSIRGNAALGIGLDGYILMAFILGFPANEIVIPIIIMSYLATGSIFEFETLYELKDLLVANGWTWLTAVSVMLFTLMHWPCATTILTIKKETQSIKWTILSFLIPTITGVVICFIFASSVRLLGLI